MKKLLMAATIAASLTSAGYSAAADTGPGCGLGSMIFDGKEGTVNHVLAGILNGISGNQTFAMSTGTLGCDVNNTIESTASAFIDQNIENVARDISRGNGEHIDALALLMGIEDSDRSIFKTTLQSSFDQIFTRDDITSSEVVTNLAAVLQQSEQLSRYVG